MQGHKEAATNLGVMHYSGEGSQQDDQLAFSWFRRAAEAGGADAQWMLGRYVRRGSLPTGMRVGALCLRGTLEQQNVLRRARH